MDELKMMTMAEITKLYPPPAPASRKPTDEELRAAGIVDAGVVGTGNGLGPRVAGNSGSGVKR